MIMVIVMAKIQKDKPHLAISLEVKDRFDSIQLKIQARDNKKFTQSEILGKLLDYFEKYELEAKQ